MENSQPSGAPDLQLPDDLRAPLLKHLAYLRERYAGRGWGAQVGFGQSPAVIVIDLALGWTGDEGPMSSNLDAVVSATCDVLQAARSAGLPIFFTTGSSDPADPPSPGILKLPADETHKPPADRFALDPRLARRTDEKIIAKPYASAFKGTNLNEMLTALRIDTLVVTGCSTSHCIYATCRDAKDSFRVIVPEEAVGERCELFHLVNMLDIEIDLADVMPAGQVVDRLNAYNEKGQPS